MIQKLLIRNYAIIEHLEIQFSEKLTIITGETGAGKSIVLGALGLIMGNRADNKVLYDESEKCVIEGYFDIRRYDLGGFFEENDIDYEPDVVIRRELTPQGKSRSFINDTPVTLKTLQDLTASLIDLHQQFDTMDIHNVSFQLRMIDALADNKGYLASYQSVYKQYQADKRRLHTLVEKSENATREIDFLNFQLAEFNKAELIDGEQTRLEDELNRLSNAENIKRTMSAAFRELSESEQSLVSKLQDIAHSVSSLNKFDSRVAKLHERYAGFIIEIQEVADEFEQIAEETEYDGQRISDVQLRLDTIYKLLKKHSVSSIAELLAIQDTLQLQLNAFGDISGEIVALENSIKAQETDLQAQADILSARRQKVVPEFEKQVHGMLAELSMEYAQLQVSIKPLAALGTTGIDDVQFLFAANRGSRLQAIKDVASGGELSRLTLCTKSLVASAIPLPTLIFDEIDSGVSGDVALKMGHILRRLASHHQVVVITHSAQVAAQADKHYFVYKSVREDRTATNVRELNEEERIRSIAVMLSSNPPTQAAIENAKSLISGL